MPGTCGRRVEELWWGVGVFRIVGCGVGILDGCGLD
jgi:hypothetical protein